MFDPGSRYAALGTMTTTVVDGEGTAREVRYVERRFIPPSDNMTTLVEHTVVQGERLDQISARYLGDPLQFWRICDANDALRPEDLTRQAGQIVRIALLTR